MRWKNGVTPYARIRKHAIRFQLDAVISLALHCGSSRREILALHLDDMHYDNAYIVVWGGERLNSPYREVPFTDGARGAVEAWLDFRASMGVDHEPLAQPLGGEDGPRADQARRLRQAALQLRRAGVELPRLRHTCGIAWLRAGMTLWEVQRFLGHATLKDTLPYGEAMKVDLERRWSGSEGPVLRSWSGFVAWPSIVALSAARRIRARSKRHGAAGISHRNHGFRVSSPRTARPFGSRLVNKD